MNDDHEALINCFRHWLDEAEEVPGKPPGEAGEPAGLLQIVEAMTALRHEVKLQTKGARNLEEHLQTALQGLREAVDDLQQLPTAAPTDEREMQVFVDALLNLDEAIGRGAQAAQTAQQRLQEQAEQFEQELNHSFSQLSAWRRWWSQAWKSQVLQLGRTYSDRVHDRLLKPLAEGYELLQTRLQKELSACRIRRIVCLGRPADPHQVTVVELVESPGEPAETVVEEVRPGYLWKDRVVRFAEVRAAKG